MTYEQDYPKFVYFIFSGYFAAVITFIFTTILARMVSPSAIGLIAMGETVMNMLLFISTAATAPLVSTYIPHYLSRKDNAKIKGIVLFIFKFSSLVLLILSFILFAFSSKIASGFFKSVDFAGVLRIVCISVFFFFLMTLFQNLAQSIKKFSLCAFSQLFYHSSKFVFVIIAIFFLNTKNYASSFLAEIATLMICLSVAITSLYLLKKLTPFFLGLKRIERKGLDKDVLNFAVNVGFLQIIAMAWAYSDKLTVGYFLSPKMWGFFSVALLFRMVVQIFSGAITSISYPNLAFEAGRKNKNRFGLIIRDTIRFYFIFLLPFSCFLIPFVKPFVNLFFPPEYLVIIFPSQLLIISTFFSAFSSIFGSSITALLKPEKTRNMTIIVAISNILFNIFFVKYAGIVGAGFAAILTYVLLLVLSFLILKKIVRITIPWYSLLKVLPASFVILFLFMAFQNFQLWFVLILSIPIVIFYFVYLIFVGELNESHLDLIEQNLPRKIVHPFTALSRKIIELKKRFFH